MDRSETDDVFCVRNLNFNPNLATLTLKLDSREQVNKAKIMVNFRVTLQT